MQAEGTLFSQDLEGFPPLPQTLETLSHLQMLGETLPLFQQIQSDNLLAELSPLAKQFQDFEDILILGTGGSSLGAQTLLALRKPALKKPRFHFLDNIDPHTFQTLLSGLSVKTTGIIAISKSGNTAETLMQLLICLQQGIADLGHAALKDHFLIISEPRDNGICRLAKTYSLPTFDHPDDVGGRFAVFTVVGMLPALIAGLDVASLRKGARQGLQNTLTNTNTPLPLAGALAHQALAQKGITQTVLMPYIDRLQVFALWFRQLWAESLGKNGHGITPIQALGTVDQHSQLQLYLDGPKDKMFTIITMDHPDDVKMTLPPIGHQAVDLFMGKTMGDLMRAEQKATIDTLRRHHCPTRVIHLNVLNEQTLGALMMHYILETLAMAHLLGVNPFDQPAVEEGKILTQRYLVM